MSNESIIGALLRDVGYELIQFEARLPGIANIRPDVLAWAADSQGNLAPWAVVEVKNSRLPIRPELALSSLVKSRDLLGTVDHYAVINGEWFKADSGLRAAKPVDGPTAPPYGGIAELSDVSLATSLLREQLWAAADHQRGTGPPTPADYLFAGVVADLRASGIETRSGAFVPVRRDVLFDASRRALVEFTSREHHSGLHVSHPVIAEAIAALVGAKLDGTVLDPFCGTGSFLWALADRARDMETRIEFLGRDLNDQMVEVARRIGAVSGLPVDIEHADAFKDELPTADVVVSAPPLALRLPERYELLDGSFSHEGDFAAVDLALRCLRPGGRAVLQVAPGFTFRTTGERYRQFLSAELRVAALMGCPPGSVPGASIGSVLLVLDKAARGTTFVAQLGEDWETQLSPNGAALAAAVQHIDGSEGSSR